MSSKPLILVTGATGIQGGSVARFLSKQNKFSLRGTTRNPKSSKALALQQDVPEIELVVANFDDPETLNEAMKGCYGVFGVTDFIEHGYDGEVRHGKALVDAAKTAGVKHLVYSTFDHTEPGDGIPVPHFESKWTVDEYLHQSGVPWTSLYTGMYMENIRDSWHPVETRDGAYVIPIAILPDAKMFMYPADETGAWVTAAFLDPGTWIGRDMRLVTEWLSTREMAAIASRVSGKHVLPMELDEESFEASRNGSEIAEELYKSKRWAVNHGPQSGVRNLEETLRLYPNPTTYEEFIEKYKDRLFP